MYIKKLSQFIESNFGPNHYHHIFMLNIKGLQLV